MNTSFQGPAVPIIDPIPSIIIIHFYLFLSLVLLYMFQAIECKLLTLSQHF